MTGTQDQGRGTDRVSVSAEVSLRDLVEHHSHWKVEKYLGEYSPEKKPVEVVEFDGNLLLNGGINALLTLVAGTGATKFDSGNAYIGVGDSATAADPTQTGLQAATNKLYKPMQAGYPTYGTLQLTTWQAIFGTTDANWAWNEYIVANSSGGTVALNRKVQSLGTKTNSFSWVITLVITLA